MLRNRRSPLDIAAAVSFFAPGVATLVERLPNLLVGSGRESLEAATASFISAGLPAGLATRAAGSGAMFSALDLVEVANAAGKTVEAVAIVYFSLGHRLQLDMLGDRIVALPREDRWQTLARAALRDDLSAEHRALTADILRTGAPEVDAAVRIEAWVGENRGPVERWEQVLADIKGGGIFNLATLSVALREIRNLVQHPSAVAAA